MILYRIFTEDKNPHDLAQLLSQWFDGFTILRADGFWKGQPEQALCVEIMETGAHTAADVHAAVAAVKALNRQECVLVQKLQIDGEFV